MLKEPPDGWTVQVLAGEDNSGNDTGDVGRFPSVAIAPDGSFAVAFYDASLHRLLYYRYYKPDDTAEILVADDGVRQVGRRQFINYTGADTAIAAFNIDPSFIVRIAYQDQSNSELRLVGFDYDGTVLSSIDNVILLGRDRNEDCYPQTYGYNCSGAYGFYIRHKLLTDGATSIIGSFYYDLPKDPDGYGIWLLMY